MFQAIHLIEERYDDPPTAKELASAVGVSLSHFHRAFQIVVGESIAQHILRLRLERAASLLKYSSWQSGEIGLACGFKTQASFSRGFKQLYGMTPLEFRKDEQSKPFLRGQLKSRPQLEEASSNLPHPTVRLEQWRELELICLRTYGTIEELDRPWRELREWAKETLPSLEGTRFFGLWFDDWLSKQERYRYECAILPARPLQSPPPEPFFLRKIEAGNMAVTFASGTWRELDKAWRNFALGWFPQSGLQPRTEFAIDEYPESLVMGSTLKQLLLGALGNLSMNLCLPVQKDPMF